MMIFFTSILLLHAVYKLANEKRRRELAKAILELDKIGIENYDDKNKANELLIKGLFYSIGLLIHIIVFVAYLSVAIKYDPFKIPTVVMFIIFLITVFVSVINSNNEKKVNKILDKKIEKRSVSGMLNQLLTIGYLFYMFLNLI